MGWFCIRSIDNDGLGAPTRTTVAFGDDGRVSLLVPDDTRGSRPIGTTQNPVRFTPSVGSTPTSGTNFQSLGRGVMVRWVSGRYFNAIPLPEPCDFITHAKRFSRHDRPTRGASLPLQPTSGTRPGLAGV